ncbi:unnamed protein product, partial [Rotaria sp. Silwood1]
MLRSIIFLLIISKQHTAIARPQFKSVFHSTVNNIKTIDSNTGLPAYSDFFQQSIDITDSDAFVGKSLPTNTRHIKLNSNAKLHSKACIVLDSIESLESVECLLENQQMLILTFNSDVNAKLIYNKWITSGTKYVNGGTQWGCRNATTGEPLVIFQRLLKLKLEKTKISIFTVKNNDIHPLLCFTDISMQLTWEQRSVRTQSTTPSLSSSKQKREVTVPGVKSIFSSWSFDPKKPLEGEIFYPGQTVNVSWSYSNMDGTTNLVIELYRKRLLLDDKISSMTTKVNVLQLSFVIPANLETSSNDRYYFQYEFWYSLLPRQRTSATFYIPTLPSIIPGVLPNANDVFYPGDIVPITWRSVNFPTTSQITVRFRRARPIIPDATLDTFTVLATANAYNYSISSSLDRADNDKYYYFEFNYCTSWYSLNCKKESNNFFVITRPYLFPTFPGVDQSFSPLQSLRLTWNSSNFASPNDLLTIKLRHYTFLLPDTDIDTFTCTVGSSGSCFYTLPAVKPTFTDYYFEVNWCKYWYSTDCTVKTNYFSIPTHSLGSWNYDEQRGQALKSKTLYLTLCSSLCPTSNIGLSYICQICNKGRPKQIQVNCTNCWTTYDYTVIEMDITRKQYSVSLDKIAVRMNSSVLVNLDFILSADYQNSFHSSLPLPTIPIGSSLGIVIGSVSFAVGLFFSPSISWNITVGALGNLSAGVDYQWKTNLTLVSTPGNTTKQYTQSLTRNIHPMQGNFQANLTVDLAFRPELQLAVGIFTIGLGTDCYVTFDSMWHYPPFSALSTSNFDWNSQKPAPIHLSFPSNSCRVAHYGRYHTMYGIRQTQISLGFSTGNILVNLFLGTVFSLSTNSFLDLGPYELSSGCMHPANLSRDISQSIYLVLNRQFNVINDTNNRYLSTATVTDLAYALNISPTRIYYNSTFSVQQNTMTGIIVVFLPSMSLSVSDPSVMTLVQQFRLQAENSKSLLYS